MKPLIISLLVAAVGTASVLAGLAMGGALEPSEPGVEETAAVASAASTGSSDAPDLTVVDGASARTGDLPAAGDAATHEEQPMPALPSTMPAMTADAAHADGLMQPTQDEIACASDLVRRTQEATARFGDYAVAVAEGYRSNPARPNATHYGNRAYRLDGNVMDLERPESLIYYTNPRTGEKALIGALFVMPRGQSGPQPCGAATQWHTHAGCTNETTGEVITVARGAPCEDGYRYVEGAEMMHVWFVPGRKNGIGPAL